MSTELENAIQSINTAADRTTKTTEFVDQLSTYDDISDVTNPNTGVTVPSLQKKTRLVAEAAFAESETQINQAVSDAELAALAAQSAANYDTEFVAGVTSAVKGKSYLYDGSMWACLSDTTETPAIGNVNWHSLANGVKEVEDRLLGVGTSLYLGTGFTNGERHIVNGDVVPVGTTHLRVLINEKVEDVRLSSFESGLVTTLTENNATIGDVVVTLHRFSNGGYQAANIQLQSITPRLGELWFNTTDNTIHMGNGVTPGGIKQVNVVNVKSFGAVGDGLTDDTTAIQAALSFASSNNMGLYSDANKTYLLSAPVSATFDSVFVDFNGSVIKAGADMQGSTVMFKLNVVKFAIVHNLEVDGDNRSSRPLEIYGTTDSTNVVTDNITARNIYGIGEGTLAVCGVRVVGTGASIKMNNTNVFGVDSDVGRSNTQGILAGRATSTEGYRNIEITNVYLRDITEAGGTAVLDSDGVKVFGYSGSAAENKTNCVIENVTQINSSGKSCKRIIKTQASTYVVKNIIGKFSNCDLFVPVDNQYGAGLCDNIDLSLDNVNIASALIGMPKFSANTGAPNDSGSTAQNINVNAENGSTCHFLTTAFLSDGELVITRSYRNWTINGLSYTAFGVIEADNDESFAEYRNINLSKSTATSDYFLHGTDASAPLQINYINAVFENVLTDRVLKSVGLYASNTTVWTRITPVSAVNSTIQFSGHIGRGGYINRPETINGVAKYTARTNTDRPNGVGRTVIKINDDDIPWGKWGFQFINFVYKSVKSGVNISNVAFTVTWDSATTVAIYELVESNVGVVQLKTPSASYNSGTGELEITFATDQTNQQQAFVDIESTVDFTVTTVFNRNV